MKKILLQFGAAVLAGLLFSAASASAASLAVNWAPGNLKGPVDVTVVSPARSYAGTMGPFQVTASGYSQNGTFLAWCLDLFDYVTPGTTYNNKYTQLFPGQGAFTEVGWELGPTREAALVKYFNWNASKVIDAASAVAFQLGLWEIVNEAPGSATSVSTGSGNFFSDIANSTVTLANTFLAALGMGLSPLEQSGKTHTLIFWDSAGYYQDLVSATIVDRAVPDVPLPAAIWLLGGGLISLFGFGRMRNKAKAAA